MKVAVITATHNQLALVQHGTDMHLRYAPGVACEYFIYDADSDEKTAKGLQTCAEKLRAAYVRVPNGRVEETFDAAFHDLQYEDFSHFFFAHDDCVPHKDSWLKAFVDRMQSGYVEPDAPEEFRQLPIGRVGALHHFWRNFSSVKGFPIQCLFLREIFESMFETPAPSKFKYADVDRVLVSRHCLGHTGIINTRTLAQIFERNTQCKRVLDRYLPYFDQGTYPKSLYPPGHHWNKITLCAEFLNSLIPLFHGFRTVGLQGDGYLEQLHGEDIPWGHDFIAHYGSPNALQALGKHFNATPQDVKRQMNNPVFLLKTHRYFKDYYQ